MENQPPEWVKERSLGKGAFGLVTLWKHRTTGERIAIKTFKDTRTGEWFRREKEMMERLNHKNLVSTLPIPSQFSAHAQRVLCMEYCAEGNLRTILNKPENCSGIPETTIRRCLEDVKDALEYLHSLNIIHRDLKPENIVVQVVHDVETFKLIDLGFGKQGDPAHLQTTMVGTSGYVAPEVFVDGYSSSVDYWSFGIICFEMVTGYRPFLPHMCPTKWMEKVRFKTDEVISVYESLTGRKDEIVFSESLPTENHITAPFARKIEIWLRLALRWDYRKRGLDRNHQLILFSSLGDILAKKIITLFCTVTYVFLSYEIDESTTVMEIKRLIMRDTKLPVENQVQLLLPSGETVSDELKLAKHWDPSLVAMFYVFGKTGITLPLEPVPPSTTVTALLEEPSNHKEPLPYHKRKRACSSSIHFLQTQLRLCEAFYEALAASVLSIVNALKNLSEQEYSVRDELVNCAAKLEVLKDSTQYNEQRYNRALETGALHGGESFVEQAKSKMKTFRSAVEQLRKQLSLLSHTLHREIEVTLTEASAFENTEATIKCLKNSLGKGYHIISNLIQMPKELRESEGNCSEIVDVVLNFLEVMDSFINDDRIRETVEKGKFCKNMINALIPKFRNLSCDVRNVNKDVRLVERGLFKAVWDIVVQAKGSEDRRAVSSSMETLIHDNLQLHRQFEESFASQREEFEGMKKRYERLTTEFPSP